MDVKGMLGQLDEIEAVVRANRRYGCRPSQVFFTRFGMHHDQPGYFDWQPDAEQWEQMSRDVHAALPEPAEMQVHDRPNSEGGGLHRASAGAPDDTDIPTGSAGYPRIVRV